MTQKERLVELLIANETRDTPEGAENESQEQYDFLKPWAEKCADHLLENGVIVPPCKVGDTVYVADLNCGIIEERINHVYITMDCDNWVLSGRAFGKTIFFTREEAEQALKERETK